MFSTLLRGHRGPPPAGRASEGASRDALGVAPGRRSVRRIPRGLGTTGCLGPLCAGRGASTLPTALLSPGRTRGGSSGCPRRRSPLARRGRRTRPGPGRRGRLPATSGEHCTSSSTSASSAPPRDVLLRVQPVAPELVEAAGGLGDGPDMGIAGRLIPRRAPRHRPPLAEPPPRPAPGLRAAAGFRDARIYASRPNRLPRVPRRRDCPECDADAWWYGSAPTPSCASGLRAVAGVQLRQPKAPRAAELPTVRRDPLLVPQPKKHPLRRLPVLAQG